MKIIKFVSTFGVILMIGISQANADALACLARTIHSEANGAGREQMNMVAESVMARARSAGRICSATNSRAYEGNKKRVTPSAQAWAVARAYINKKSGGWTHFLNVKLQQKKGRKLPKWYFVFKQAGCQTKRVGSGDKEQIFFNINRCNRRVSELKQEFQVASAEISVDQRANSSDEGGEIAL